MSRRGWFKMLGLTVAGLLVPKLVITKASPVVRKIIRGDGMIMEYVGDKLPQGWQQYSHSISDPGHSHSCYCDYCQGLCSGHHHTINDPGHSHRMIG